MTDPKKPEPIDSNENDTFQNRAIIEFAMLPTPAKHAFFEWTSLCGQLMGLTKGECAALLPNFDPCWYYAYNDEFTPEQAVCEYRGSTGLERPEIPEVVKQMLAHLPEDLKKKERESVQ